MEDEDCHFEELAHTADVGARVRAVTPAALFACAARSLFALIGTRPRARGSWQRVTVAADDVESLLVTWLNELLYLHETTGNVVADIRMTRWSPTSLEAEVCSSPAVTPPRSIIKAVTYHRLRVTEEAGGWLAEYYVDV